jgi:hypothetical protein
MTGKRRVDWTNMDADAAFWMMVKRHHSAADKGRGASVL